MAYFDFTSSTFRTPAGARTLRHHEPTPLDIQRWEDDGGAVPPNVRSRTKRHLTNRTLAEFDLCPALAAE